MLKMSLRGRRAAWMVVIAAVCLLAPTVVGVVVAVRSNVNDVRDWLPSHFVETEQYRWFRERFGSEDFVVVSWPGCTLDDPRLDQLSDELQRRSERHARDTGAPLFLRVTTGRRLLDELASDRVGFTRGQAVGRLRGTVIGPDGKQTCAVVVISDDARRGLRALLNEIRAAAVLVDVPADDVHLGGPAVVNDAIDESSTQSLVQLAGLAAVIGLGVAWLCFRDVRLTIYVFLIAGYGAMLSLAFVPLCGAPLNAILITMVPLVYVAGMSGAIHLTNYYLESAQRTDPQRAIVDSIRHASVPLGLASTTTAIGLLSLWYSDLAPIRLFGVFSAAGVVIGLVTQVTLLPALLLLWPPARGEQQAAARSADEEALEAEPLSPGWQRLATFVERRHAWVSLAFVGLLAAGIAGLTRVETSIQIMRLFAPQTRIISSYAWLEENLGALVPMEVVIRFDSANELPVTQRLQLIRELHERITEIPGVSGCLSAATFTPRIKLQGSSLRNAVANVRLQRAQARIAEAGYFHREGREEAWRISVRVAAGEDLDYGEFQRQLRAKVEPVLAREREAGAESAGVEAIYTGAVPIIYKARRGLLDGLIWGFGTDVLLVVIAVVALMRSGSSGVLLLLTSVFPMAGVFGLMGWCGWVVDIGSVMTPCVALGVTIDDAIHFVLWYGRGVQRGLSQAKAVDLAYSGCGRAMVQSWGVIGIGLSAFALSTFIPTFRFGALTLALLTVALGCNLLFLPALLAGPLGRWLGRRLRKNGESAAHSA